MEIKIYERGVKMNNLEHLKQMDIRSLALWISKELIWLRFKPDTPTSEEIEEWLLKEYKEDNYSYW